MTFLELITNSVERFNWAGLHIAHHLKVSLTPPALYCIAVQMELDRRLGCIWHAIVGEEFSCDLTYEVSSHKYSRVINRLWKG